jgi:3-isopropylmalate dehydratase small subunit
VDCFLALGVQAIVAESFGAIYERNAINAGLPIVIAPLVSSGIQAGQVIRVDFTTGAIESDAPPLAVQGKPFSNVQLRIYQRGGLLVAD